MAGYSKTPLAQKLGIKADAKVITLNPPTGYRKWLAPLPERVSFVSEVKGDALFVPFFVSERKVLEKELKRLRNMIADAGTLWISWPKKTSGVATDITADPIRRAAVPPGLWRVTGGAVEDRRWGVDLV